MNNIQSQNHDSSIDVIQSMKQCDIRCDICTVIQNNYTSNYLKIFRYP